MNNDLAWLLIIAVGMCGLGIASIVGQARIAQLVDELKGALIGRTITITVK